MSVPSQPIIKNLFPFTRSDRVELYWQPPLSNGGSNITSYIIECPNIPYIEVLSNTARKSTILNLNSNTNYLFTIKATNIYGNSNVAVYNLVQPGFKPANPANLQFTSNIDNYSKLQFTFNESSNIGSSKITHNIVTLTPIDVSGNILVNSSLKNYVTGIGSNIVNPIVIERMNTNFDYKAQVRARNSINYSDNGDCDFNVNPNLPTNGLKLWLDPYDLTTIKLSNGKVTTWVDKSFNKANATISETFAPTYDSNTDVLVFNGNQYLNLPANTIPSSNTSYTIFSYVSTSNISRNGQWFLYSGTPESNLSLGGLINGNLITHSWFNNNQVSNSNINSSISYLLEMNYTNGLRKTLINGNLIAQDFVGFRNTTTGNNIIGSNSTINSNLVGTIGDIIIYDRLLNDIERRSVNNYLQRKKFTLSLQNMGNLVAWLDSSDNNTLYDPNIYTKASYNNNVFSWVDKSGLNNNARQPNISLAPIRRPYLQNNLDVLEFNQSYFTIPTAYYPLDAYIVLKLNNNGETYGLLGVGPNSNNYSSLSYNTSGGNLWSINNTSNSIITGNIETSGNFLLMEWSIGANNNVIRRYGSNISNITLGTFTLPANSNIIIGNNNGFDLSKRFKGYMGEILLFNRQLNDNDRQQIEGYLAWKWGLQSYLLSTHPYKNSSPYLFNRNLVSSLLPVPNDVYLSTINITFAYSVRQVISTYNGPILQIRRSSDNAISDFYSDALQTYLSTSNNGSGSSYSAWIGGSIGYIIKWYDQSGKGNHAVNSSYNTTQPNLIQQNNKWVIQWVSNNATRLELTTPSTINTVFSQFWNNNSNYGSIISSNTDLELRFGGSGGALRIDGDGNSSDWWVASSGTKIAYANGINVTSSLLLSGLSVWQTLSISLQNPAFVFYKIGMDGYAESRSINGYMTEMIGHNTQMTSTSMLAFYANRLIL